METSFPNEINQPDRGELAGNQLVVQQYARYPATTMEAALPSASSIESARSRLATSQSPPLNRKETPRSLQTSPAGRPSIVQRASSVRSRPSMSPPIFDSLRHRQSRDSMDRAGSRELPSRDITDKNIDDAYITFIFYCNPNVPGSVDTTELRKTFRSPPRSDGKSFSTFTLWELIRKLHNQELKTWIQLAIELGVEPPSMEKKQSTQKVQQYAVRLKRWMRAMHVDAFFEFCLGNSHQYYTQLPSANDIVSDFRDGVPLEEDLALRALVPQWKPKRGRKRAEVREGDEERPAKRPSLDTSVGVLHGGPVPPNSFPQSAIPFSAFPDDMESSDPWAATSSFPTDPPNPEQGQDHLRWRPLERDASPAGYPQSAILPRSHPTDSFLSAEPRSAVVPSTGEKAKSRRRHGPLVSSRAAWSGNNGTSTGKSRGRPPNRATSSGPFSTFPVNPARDESSNGGTSARPASSMPMDQNFSQLPFPPGPQGDGKPGKLQVHVPQQPGGPVRLATPPTLLVNGVDGSGPKTEGQQNESLQSIPNGPSDSPTEEITRQLTNKLLGAKVTGRPTALNASEAGALAATVVRNLISTPTKENSSLLAAFHLGLNNGLASSPLVVNFDPSGVTYSIIHEYTCASGMSTKVTYNNLRITPSTIDKPNTVQDTEDAGNSIEDLDCLTDAEFEVDTAENGVSDATWKQRYIRLRAQMQKKEKALARFKRNIVASVMAEI